jgi:uncharacterized membrane protein (UPF0127 family)
MRFPIDVIYLDWDFTVVHFEVNLQPWRFSPLRLQATSVLELPHHTVTETGTTIGDNIEISVQA